MSRLARRTSLPLSGRRFLGHAVEYHFPVGDSLLRAVGLLLDVRAGQMLQVRFRKAKLFSDPGLG
jgi:hypothetical protein